MSLLKIVTEQEADTETKQIFNEIKEAFGMLPAGISLWSMNPKALKYQWESIKEVFALDEDTQKMHTIIRYLISEKNHCEYCIGLNGSMLLNMFGMSENNLKELHDNLGLAKLPKKQDALLRFAISSIENPKNISNTDINNLRNIGIEDKEIFDIVLAASQMLVVNTLFDTFDVK